LKDDLKGKLIFTYQSESYFPNKSRLLGLLEFELIFHKYIFYDKGIEFHFRSEKKKPIYLSNTDIIDVSFYSSFHYKFLESFRDYMPYWFQIETANKKIMAIYSDIEVEDTLKDLFTQKGCLISVKKFKNRYGEMDISINTYSFSKNGFKITFLDGTTKNYLWDDIISVSYDPFIIQFDQENELSVHYSEGEFRYTFRKNYEKYIDKLEEIIFKEPNEEE